MKPALVLDADVIKMHVCSISSGRAETRSVLLTIASLDPQSNTQATDTYTMDGWTKGRMDGWDWWPLNVAFRKVCWLWLSSICLDKIFHSSSCDVSQVLILFYSRVSEVSCHRVINRVIFLLKKLESLRLCVLLAQKRILTRGCSCQKRKKIGNYERHFAE